MGRRPRAVAHSERRRDQHDLAGPAAGHPGHQQLDGPRAEFGGRRGDWSLQTRFHFGGFARGTPELTAFAADFAARHGLTPEPVYVAKMLYGIFTLAREGAFPPGTRVAAVITG